MVASVSCIYGLGLPAEYLKRAIRLTVGAAVDPARLAARLEELHYLRCDGGGLDDDADVGGCAGPSAEAAAGDSWSATPLRGQFSLRAARVGAAATLLIGPSHSDQLVRVDLRQPETGAEPKGTAAASKVEGLDSVGAAGTEKAGVGATADVGQPELRVARISTRRRQAARGEALDTPSAVAAAAAAAAIAASQWRAPQPGGESDGPAHGAEAGHAGGKGQCIGDGEEGGDKEEDLEEVALFPATHFVAAEADMARVIAAIREELAGRVAELEEAGMWLEAQVAPFLGRD